MPIITVDSDDLKSLIGRKISDEELRRALPLAKMLIEDWNGTELKIEVTPDRPDLFSAEGMARQLASWLGVSTGLERLQIAPAKIQVNASKVSLRPYITCGLVRGVRMSDHMIKSIMQLQETLDLTLGRDRKKVAIGLHDISKVKPPFYYKEVLPGDVSFVPLNSTKKMTMGEVIKSHPKGVEYAHLVKDAKKWPIILDSNGHVLSFPPIINGELSKVTEETTDMFIDITGYDDKAINFSLNILLAALAKRGGRIEYVNVGGAMKPDLNPRMMAFNADEARKMLGLSLSNKEMQSLLSRMGYDSSSNKSEIEAMAPAYRADILHPVDVIEDIAVAYGFDQLTPEMPKLASVGEAHPLEELTDTLRELMIGLGFQEVMNYTLTSSERQFARMNTSAEEAVQLENPISQDHSECRRWLLPGLMENSRTNKHRRFPQRIFEAADCIVPDKAADVKALNVRKLSGLITHSQANLSEIISTLNAIKENMGLHWEMKPIKHASFIDGRCGSIHINGKDVGLFGELHPKTILNYDLNNPVAAFELDVQKIFIALHQKPI